MPYLELPISSWPTPCTPLQPHLNQFLQSYTLITVNYFPVPKLSHRLPRCLGGTESSCNSGDTGDGHRFDPWVRKIPLRRKLQPPPVFLPGEPPWTEKPGGLQSMGSQRAGYDWACSLLCLLFPLGHLHCALFILFISALLFKPHLRQWLLWKTYKVLNGIEVFLQWVYRIISSIIL